MSVMASRLFTQLFVQAQSLAFVRGINWWPLNSPHKGRVMRKMFPFDDVILSSLTNVCISNSPWYRYHVIPNHSISAVITLGTLRLGSLITIFRAPNDTYVSHKMLATHFVLAVQTNDQNYCDKKINRFTLLVPHGGGYFAYDNFEKTLREWKQSNLVNISLNLCLWKLYIC